MDKFAPSYFAELDPLLLSQVVLEFLDVPSLFSLSFSCKYFHTLLNTSESILQRHLKVSVDAGEHPVTALMVNCIRHGHLVDFFLPLCRAAVRSIVSESYEKVLLEAFKIGSFDFMDRFEKLFNRLTVSKGHFMLYAGQLGDLKLIERLADRFYLNKDYIGFDHLKYIVEGAVRGGKLEVLDWAKPMQSSLHEFTFNEIIVSTATQLGPPLLN